MARFLIAEDEEPVRKLLARALAKDGHEAVTAADGAEALERLSCDSFDLLLTDIRMPVMDGIALALAAARDFPDLPIVMMTGYANEKERAQGLDKLVHEVVLKPFTIHDMKRSLAAALKSRGKIS
jgi:two-component system cell cycle response regulator CpdR